MSLKAKMWATIAMVAGLASAPSGAVAQSSALETWPRLMDQLKAAGAAGDAALPPGLSEQDLAEVAVMKLGALMSGYLNIVHSDPDHPIFRPAIGLYVNYAAPNADTLYFSARIDGEGVYRIRGEAGDVPIVNLGPRRTFSKGGDATAAPFVDYDLVKYRKGPNGEIDVVLSAKRPDGYTGDWLYLDPRADTFSVRFVSDDWGRQKDPRLAIERLDRPSRKTRPTAAEIDSALGALPAAVTRSVATFANHVAKFEKDVGANVVKEFDYSAVGALTDQRYFEMVWNFRPDEALILESPLPKCRYWSVLLADPLYATLDWINNQSSLNRSQARVDSDGRIRVVIAHSDPGVPNWLDTVGRPRGGMQWRWMGCDDGPTPTVRRVRLADVKRSLPADTPSVTPAERDQALRERRALAQLRRQW
jgi:hypothetical protein